MVKVFNYLGDSSFQGGYVSIELPEANIFATQLNEALVGKKIESYDLKDFNRMIKIGFIKNISIFEDIVDKTVLQVTSRGNTILVKMDGGMNLLIGPEYGGVIRYHCEGVRIPKYHLRLDFTDGSKLTIRITSMGLLSAFRDEGLDRSYMYRRDFLGETSPLDKEFTFKRFFELIYNQNRQIKSLLVGKEAKIVGLSNASYQDIIYRAGIHPKCRASELSKDEIRALYDAIKRVIEERLNLGGKDQFTDIYGKSGGYSPAMGPNMKNQQCHKCGTSIERLAHGGGHVYLCPNCQKK
jgi:formamidopyrimidine-DNA glycosylase